MKLQHVGEDGDKNYENRRVPYQYSGDKSLWEIEPAPQK